MAVEADLVNRVAAIADFTDTSVFVPEVVEEGGEAPHEWLGLNLEDSKDSAEVIDSSDEGGTGRRKRRRRRRKTRATSTCR